MIEPFVSPAWLQEHREEVVLADVRYYLDGRNGREAHAAGHLPGAVYVDLGTVLAGPASETGGRHPLPDPASFAAGLSAVGIGDDAVVVAYDDAGGVMAARLVWMLRAVGQDAALLDGGLGSGPLEEGAVVPATATATAREWPVELLATVDDATDRGRVVLDARPPERYAGAPDALDPRAGHVPGARNVPARGNVDAEGRLLPVDELRERFAAAGVTAASDVVSTCGSGVTACHNLLALEQAGLGRGRLWPGSWSAYSRDASRPVVTGAEPG
ncbi:sulfurtransferase [Patulibacter sp.]|uniref:sulfurtransferase n=1 Tax=Patulibacter sp. TaxID=1912859 RepID=UPI00271D23E9|nr:sulfurtransferase [Patulibacter sp.]MDO9407498.1 sulfurtransferase [Patulibacter sp.]